MELLKLNFEVIDFWLRRLFCFPSLFLLISFITCFWTIPSLSLISSLTEKFLGYSISLGWSFHHPCSFHPPRSFIFFTYSLSFTLFRSIWLRRVAILSSWVPSLSHIQFLWFISPRIWHLPRSLSPGYFLLRVYFSTHNWHDDVNDCVFTLIEKETLPIELALFIIQYYCFASDYI